MNLRKKTIGIFSLLLTSMILAACGPTVTPAPTVDVNALYTQAAVTMIAQLTQNAPTITPTVPPTATPAVTATLAPLPTLAGVLPTLPPLATSTSIAAATGDKALYVTQSPADNTSVKTNQVFNIIWRLRNTGTTTWNNQYTYRFYSAANKLPTSANGYNLTQNVPPNSEVELKVVATAPGTPGTYDTRWVITNPEGVNFSSFDLTINVVQGASSGGVEATATGVPSVCDDYGTVGGVTATAGGGATGPITTNGGQVRVYYKLKSGTTAADLIINYTQPEFGSGEQYVQVKSTNEGSIVVGKPSKDGNSLTFTATLADVEITKIVWWKSNYSCN